MLLSTVLLCCSTFSVLALSTGNEKQEKPKFGSDYILPYNKIIPKSYKVTIDVSKSFDAGTPSKFTGDVEIIALVNESKTEEIVLHAVDINFDNAEIIIMDAARPVLNRYISHFYDSETQFLRIKLSKPFKKGRHARIIFTNFEGNLRDDMMGFYVNQYTEESSPNSHYVLATQFGATYARRAFPCFDEPIYKATFELTFKIPKGYQVLSNTLAKEVNNEGNIIEVNFPASPKMSTYLVAFVIHKFAKSPTENPIYNVWSRPEAKSQTKCATDYMYRIVHHLDEFTGIEYEKHMPKMDIVALPDSKYAAMDNWGLITYKEAVLLADEELTTNKNIQNVVQAIAHEIAHQWFGNLVTPTWWNNTWLNEGLATYLEYYMTDKIQPDWDVQDQFVVEKHQRVLEVDASADSTPLNLNVYTPSEISSHFNSISYSKGASLIKMMEHFLGSDVLKTALQNYLKKNKLGNTVPEDLFFAIQKVIDKKKILIDYTLQSIMSSWIAQAGYPVINVESDGNGHFNFSQEPFLINPEESETKLDQKWYVPISYTTANTLNFTSTRPKFWLTPHDLSRIITENTDFLIVNIQESGYYRVNYGRNLWRKIAKVLPQKNNIHYLNKAQIIDDVLNLARAGKVDYKIAFDVTDYLAEERNYYPWRSAFQGFNFLLQRYSDINETGIEIRKYVKNLMKHLTTNKNFSGRETQQIDIFNTVAALGWNCYLGNEDCVSEATRLFKDFKDNNRSIPKNFKAIVYCTAIRHGNEADWEFLWTKYKKSNVAAERIDIIHALGCSINVEILNRFLGYSMDFTSGIREQDVPYVFSAIIKSEGVDVASAFLKENYKKIIRNYKGMNTSLRTLVMNVGAHLTDPNKINEFKEFLGSNNDFAIFREEIIKTVDQNLKWSQRYSTIIKDIMLEKNFATGLLANKFLIILLGFVSIRIYIFS